MNQQFDASRLSDKSDFLIGCVGDPNLTKLKLIIIEIKFSVAINIESQERPKRNHCSWSDDIGKF